MQDNHSAPRHPPSELMSSSEKLAVDLERGQSWTESQQKAALNLEIKGLKRSSSKVVFERLRSSSGHSDKESSDSTDLSSSSSNAGGGGGGGGSGSASATTSTPGGPLSPTSQKLLSPRGQSLLSADLTNEDFVLIFGVPKLKKLFSQQGRPLNLLVRLLTELPDPKLGVPMTRKLVGFSRTDTFTERDIISWLVKNKFTAAASSSARIVELLQKDYVICEVKKGVYRFMDEEEKKKARVEEERLVEQKVQRKLAQLAKDQKKAQKKGKNAKTFYQVIGVDLVTLLNSQKGEYPTLEVPFLLVRFAADVISLNGTKEEGIFRLSIGTEEVAQMVHQINSENSYTLVRQDPNVAAVMMKRFLRDLPEPLCTDYDGAIKLATTKAPDASFNAFFDALPVPNQSVIKFIANFIFRMTRPEVVAATRMDINNYAIVFTPGFLRSKSVDLTAMANQAFEQEFVVRLVQLVRSRFPDDTVGELSSVPKPYVAPSLTSQQDLRVLYTDTPEVMRQEDILKQAEERLKAAKRDLNEAKKQEKKEMKDHKAVEPARKAITFRKASVGKADGKQMAETVRTPAKSDPRGDMEGVRSPSKNDVASPTSPGFLQSSGTGLKPLAKSGKSPQVSPRQESVAGVAGYDALSNDTPPKPIRTPPTLPSTVRKDSDPVPIVAPAMPPLPPVSSIPAGAGATAPKSPTAARMESSAPALPNLPQSLSASGAYKGTLPPQATVYTGTSPAPAPPPAPAVIVVTPGAAAAPGISAPPAPAVAVPPPLAQVPVPTVSVVPEKELPPAGVPHEPGVLSPRGPTTPFEEFLHKAKVLDYIDAFHDYGIESIDDLKELEEEDLDSIGLKVFYRKRLVRMINELKGEEVAPEGAEEAHEQDALHVAPEGRARSASQESSGDLTSDENDGAAAAEPFVLPPEQRAGLLEATVALQEALTARSDTAILKGCRAVTERVMSVSGENASQEAEGLRQLVVSLNTCVMHMLKESYADAAVEDTQNVVSELHSALEQLQ